MTIGARESSYDEVVDSARDFRVLLAAMARPGSIHDLAPLHLAPPPELHVASASVALALLSADTTCCVAGLPGHALDYLATNTRCERSAVDSADFVFFASADKGEEQLARMKRGTLNYPDQGATIVAQLTELSPEPDPAMLRVYAQGPGIDGTATFYAKGMHPVWLATLRACNSEYPLGVDAIFTCGSRLVCLPRSASLQWE